MQKKGKECLLHVRGLLERNLNLLRRSVLKCLMMQNHLRVKINKSTSYYRANNRIRSWEVSLQIRGWQLTHLKIAKAFQKWLFVQCLTLSAKWITQRPADLTKHRYRSYREFAQCLQRRVHMRVREEVKDLARNLTIRAKKAAQRYPKKAKEEAPTRC